MSKKVNPRRRPATQADVNKAKRQAKEEAVTFAWAIMFNALRDSFGFGPSRLRKLWGKVNSISDSISEGYIDIQDLIDVLKDEAGIELE